MQLRAHTNDSVIRDFYHAIPRQVFAEPCKRPTLAVIPKFGNAILLVNHVKAPLGHMTLLQEGIERNDRTLAITLQRCFKEELDLTEGQTGYSMSGARFLEGEFDNVIPADRVSAEMQGFMKCTTFVMVPMKVERVVPNQRELRMVRWVNSWSAFAKLTISYAERRPYKRRAIVEVLNQLCTPMSSASGKLLRAASLNWGPAPEELLTAVAASAVH